MNDFPKVLVVTDDTLSETMAGPAIRAFEISRALSKVATVKLASTVPVSLSHPDFEIIDMESGSFKKLSEWADVLVFQGALLSTHPYLAKTNKIIVADIYDPMHLEALEQLRTSPAGQRFIETLDVTAVMNEQIARADYLLCASDKQRDFWLGQMAAIGRLNPFTYDSDTSLRNLIGVVPFGVQNEAPVQTSHGIRGQIPGIGLKDKVVLWGGGIYNWFDPLTLIRAIEKLSHKHKDIRLVFMGTQHPNPHVPEMKMSFQARELSKDLGLENKFVFFNEGWVPYNERANFLLDADIGVSTHLEHLETAFSFRTRVLDYLWAGLPIVATNGDTFESIIEHNQLGITVPPSDVDALAAAMETILYSKKEIIGYQKRVNAFGKSMRWENALEPLVQFVSNPRRAADAGQRYSRYLTQMDFYGRRTIRQRALLFRVSWAHNGLRYTASLFLKNLLGKTYRKFKRLMRLG